MVPSEVKMMKGSSTQKLLSEIEHRFIEYDGIKPMITYKIINHIFSSKNKPFPMKRSGFISINSLSIYTKIFIH
jgi:hypothetical protein